VEFLGTVAEWGPETKPPVGVLGTNPAKAGDRLQIMLQLCTLKGNETVFCQFRRQFYTLMGGAGGSSGSATESAWFSRVTLGQTTSDFHC